MHPVRTRHLTTTIAVSGAALAVALGTAMPALADPPAGHGGGNGNGNSPSVPPGQAKQAASPAPTTPSEAATSPMPTSTHVPPGQAKKPSSGAPSSGARSNNSNRSGSKAGKGNGKGNATHDGGNKSHSGKGSTGKGGAGKGANGPSGHNPPGNNGTVKIHAIAGDTGHHNVAHPGCAFVVDFWGFDAGQSLSVSFTGQAPTGAGTPLHLSGSATSITSPDDAGGGNDPDGELVFTPTVSELSVLGAPAHQGYHVRLTVATGQGGGQKQKVFWLEPCAPEAAVAPPAPMPTPSDTPTLSTDHPTVVTDSDSSTVDLSAPTRSAPQLDTARLTRATPRVNQASPPLASLPFTGANLSTLIASGILVLLAGTAITLVTRRRKLG